MLGLLIRRCQYNHPEDSIGAHDRHTFGNYEYRQVQLHGVLNPTFSLQHPHMAQSAPSILTALEAVKEQFDQHSERYKAGLLDVLAEARLRSASELLRFHELLCFMRAYPDGPAVLERVDTLLDCFDLRSDLKKLAKDLVNTGIAGTRIDYEFYWVTAEWLCRHWPEAIEVRWREPFVNGHKLHVLLRSLLPYAELILLDEAGCSPRDWIELVRGPDETDAAFLVHRFEKLQCRDETREMLFEDLDIPMSIMPGPDTPSRTKARYAASPVVWQKKARFNKRPVLRSEILKPPIKVTAVSRQEGARLIKLARQSMVTREREVDAFANASADDVFIVDCEQGLQFIGMGARPDRRHILESVYIFLILKNGMPIGYVQPCSLFGSAEVNFNVFESFRGADAGWLYGRALATIHHLTKADCFVLDPYQVGGHGNTEGLKTGAWWFYYKMGFRPRDPEIRRLGLEEARKVKANRRYRTPIAVLRELGEAEMYLYLGKKRDDVLSVFPLANLGLQITRMLAQRFGADREKAITTCVKEACKLLGVQTLRNLNKSEKQAWERWSPLLVALPGVTRWGKRDKRAAAALITAKGSRREVEYLHQLNRHTRLRKAIGELAYTPADD